MQTECSKCHALIECDSALINSAIQCPQCNADIVVKPIIKVVKGSEPERIIMSGRPSLIAQLPGMFIGFILGISGFGAVQGWKETNNSGLLMMGVFLVICGAILFFKPLLAHFGTKYTLTNKKISLNKGILSKNETSVRIADIKAVNVKRSFCDALIGCGTVSIGSAATGSLELQIPNIPHYKKLKDEIEGLR